jgi:hypothetical protein
LIYLAVFVALAAAYWAFESRTPSGEPEVADELTVWNVGFQDVAAAEYNNRDFEARIVKTDQGHWKLTRPVETPADRWEVESLIRRGLEAKKSRVLGDVEDLGEFGLKEPRIALTLFGSGDGGGAEGPVAPTLFVGGQNPTQDQYYARLDGTRQVFLLSGALEYDLNKTLYDLRDKSLALTPGETVDRVAIETDAGRVALDRAGLRKWTLSEPLEAKADDDRATRLIYEGLKSRAEMFMEIRPNMDLDDPRAEVRIESAGQVVEVLTVGGEAEVRTADGENVSGVWVKSSKRNRAGLARPVAMDLILVAADDLIDLDLVELDRAALDRLEIEAGRWSMTAEVGQGGWNLVQPGDLDLTDARIENFVKSVDDMAYDRRVAFDPDRSADWGLDAPAARITFGQPGGRTRLSVGLPPDRPQAAAIRIDESDHVFLVDRQAFSKAWPLGGPAEFRSSAEKADTEE